jgi:lysophospholipase L1-like esterase
MSNHSIEPIRPLFLLFSVASLCLLLIFFSTDEIKISEDFSIKIFNQSAFVPPKQVENTDITFVNALATQVDLVESDKDTLAAPESNLMLLDTTPVVETEAEKQTLKAQKASSGNPIAEKDEAAGNVRQEIQIAEDGTHPLKNFFGALSDIAVAGGHYRVVHYGDSQIEGDRISKYLRKRLQKRFGGCGAGMIPPSERANARATLVVTSSPAWQKHAYADSRKRPAHGKVGLLQSYFTFANDENQNRKAWVKFSASYMDGGKSTKIQNFKLLYRTPSAPMRVEATQGGKDTLVLADELPASDDFEVLEHAFDGQFKSLLFRFESKGNPELLGICLDCNDGVTVDNVPLRGSAGLDFTKSDKEFLRKQIKALNVRLMILQFGVNLVPSGWTDYSFFEKQLTKQLTFLKSLDPNLDILLVGVSDMSRLREGVYASHPNVERVRNAQKNAALKSGCAFWDLYEAMGGHNSMISWVRSKPSLATTDYTHFNERGANLVAEMLYEALIKSYEEYKKSQ